MTRLALLALCVVGFGFGCGTAPRTDATFSVEVQVPATITQIVVDGTAQTLPADGDFTYARTYASYAEATSAADIEFDFYDNVIVEAVGYAHAGACITIGETGRDKFPYDVDTEAVDEGDNLAFTAMDYAHVDCTFADGTKIEAEPS
jgi:hypothetical protein